MHMVMAGDGFTRIVQKHVLDGSLKKAELLLDGVTGLTAQERKAILSGDGVFLGNTICDDESCRVCKDLQKEGPFRFAAEPDTEYKKALAKAFVEIGGVLLNRETVEEYVNHVKSYRRKMAMRGDPALLLRMENRRVELHRAIFAEAKLPYHGGLLTKDTLTKKQRTAMQFQQALSAYLGTMGGEL